MSDFLLIRLTDYDRVEWLVADSNGTLQSSVGSGPLAQAARLAAERPVIVLIPAEDTLSTTVNIPARGNAKVRAALPFALEEDLADDIEDLHFSVGDRQDNNRLPVAVVSRDKLQGWIDQLSAVGIEPAKIVPLNHGLAKIPGTLSILVDGENVLFNDGDDKEFVLQSVKPSDVLVIADELGQAENDDSEKSGHLLAFCTPEQEQHLSHDWIALRHEMDSVDVSVLPDGAFPKLAVTVAAGHGINLLQGEFGKKTEYAALFRPWRIAAMLLLGFVLTAMTLKGIDSYRMAGDEAALRAQFATEYRAVRPNDTREILDPAATVDSLRRSLGGSVSPQVFLPSMRELAIALAANSDIDIEGISYRAGTIDLRLTAPDVQTLDAIQRAVSASGRFRASIQRTDQVADKIDGRIQIRESGS